MASLPLLMVYYVTYDRTDIVVPVILRPLLGTNVDLSILVCKGSDETRSGPKIPAVELLEGGDFLVWTILLK